jgi:hypothetical protein
MCRAVFAASYEPIVTELDYLAATLTTARQNATHFHFEIH